MADEQPVYFATVAGCVNARKIEVSSHVDGSMLIKVGGERLDLHKDEVDLLLFLMGARRDR